MHNMYSSWMPMRLSRAAVTRECLVERIFGRAETLARTRITQDRLDGISEIASEDKQAPTGHARRMGASCTAT